MPKEVCPVCGKEEEVEIVREDDIEIKRFSCGYRTIHVSITEVLRLRDKVEVTHIKESLKQK